MEDTNTNPIKPNDPLMDLISPKGSEAPSDGLKLTEIVPGANNNPLTSDLKPIQSSEQKPESVDPNAPKSVKSKKRLFITLGIIGGVILIGIIGYFGYNNGWLTGALMPIKTKTPAIENPSAALDKENISAALENPLEKLDNSGQLEPVQDLPANVPPVEEIETLRPTVKDPTQLETITNPTACKEGETMVPDANGGTKCISILASPAEDEAEIQISPACTQNTLVWTDGKEINLPTQKGILYCVMSPDYSDSEQGSIVYDWKVDYEGRAISNPPKTCSGSLNSNGECGPCFTYEDLDKNANISVKIKDTKCEHDFKYISMEQAEIVCTLDLSHDYKDNINELHIDGFTITKNNEVTKITKQILQDTLNTGNVQVLGNIAWQAQGTEDIGDFVKDNQENLGNEVKADLVKDLESIFNQKFIAQKNGNVSAKIEFTSLGVNKDGGEVKIVKQEEANLLKQAIVCEGLLPVKAQDEPEVVETCENIQVSVENTDTKIVLDEGGNALFTPQAESLELNPGQAVTLNYAIEGDYVENFIVNLNWTEVNKDNKAKIFVKSAYSEEAANTKEMAEDGANQVLETNEKSIVLKVYENAIANASGNLVIAGPTEGCTISIPFKISAPAPKEACILNVQPVEMFADSEPQTVSLTVNPADYLNGNYAISLKNVKIDEKTLSTGTFTHQDKEDVEGLIDNVNLQKEIKFTPNEPGYVVAELYSDTVAQIVDCSGKILIKEEVAAEVAVIEEETEEPIAYTPTVSPDSYVPPAATAGTSDTGTTGGSSVTYTPSSSGTSSSSSGSSGGSSISTGNITQPINPSQNLQASVGHTAAPDKIGGDTGPEVIIYAGLLGLAYFIYVRIRRRKNT